MQRDSVSFTFLVATVLCVVCSFLVSGAADLLRPIQEKNKELDKSKNVLLAAGLIDSSADPATVTNVFSERIRSVMINLDSGEPASESEAPKGYDPRKAAKNPALQQPVEPPDALRGIRFREPIAPVYLILEEGEEGAEPKVEGYILPIYGKGLWSTLYGFLALDGDARTVRGITFYEHGETPGLGGEVDNPNWKSTWKGKIALEDGEVLLHVLKGGAPEGSPAAASTIDGLSGATLTTKGVDALVQYWLGPQGFGPYLEKLHPEEGENPEAGQQAGATAPALVEEGNHHG
ncbi:MAG: Na(+)-translocating NADH-quinone reductase subunit C [Planctomycetales bacterium]|nr:Na(+)-translocating NADH-quinone reductase subunit C [Planctomycetales bacterium]